MKKTNHVLHLILTLLTGGLWLFVWISLVVVRRKIPGVNVVRVAHRELGEAAPDRDPNDLDYGYAYAWRLPQPPQLGDRVYVESGSPAVVVGFGSNYRGELASVARFASPAEIAASTQKVNADRDTWLSMARRAADLPTNGSVPSNVPDGYPEVAPTDGVATAGDADSYGRMWWRAYKAAEEAEWPVGEVQRFRSIAHRWYAIRDKGGNV
ncbi:hypothetical protein [Microbacterium sp. NIBRBAC000506063]|uniref:hypothetical protein n=1 Tax=Microbacterium sp. NIBRBAC000506063 TaxID=2734618 RepID=UPI001BB5937B|nr:hypothetical protein [Microbacterium sp. NIBRBAC000506063]QTV80732.1 hypothetical protein KAE78_11390 [Microbacterium sp. NIBRBAC000506063]